MHVKVLQIGPVSFLIKIGQLTALRLINSVQPKFITTAGI